MDTKKSPNFGTRLLNLPNFCAIMLLWQNAIIMKF